MCAFDKKKVCDELGIPEAVYQELVDACINKAEQAYKDFFIFAAESDVPAICRLAHELKGAAGNLRLHPLCEISQEIEIMAKDLKPINDIRDTIKSKYPTILANLKRAYTV